MASTQQRRKTVLITGCSPDSIGSSLALEFHRRHFHVIVTARCLSRLQHLQSLGIQCCELDVTSSTSIQSLHSTLQLTHLDILLNNAGGLLMRPISDMTMQEWRSIFDLNVFSVFEITHTFLPELIAAKGMVVNHSSQNAYFNLVAAGPYAISKAAVEHYSGTLRNELHPFGVRVVTLVSGVVKSNITMNVLPSLPGTIIKPSSLYYPIRTELETALSGVSIRGKEMDADVYAKKIVSDLVDGAPWWWLCFGATPKWIWRGTTGSLTYWLWFTSCFWKGIWDGPCRRLCGLNLLPARLAEMERKNTA